jgi:hypothetical protein
MGPESLDVTVALRLQRVDFGEGFDPTMWGPWGIRLTGPGHTDYRSPRGYRRIEFVRVVGEEEDLVAGQSDLVGNPLVGPCKSPLRKPSAQIRP